MTTQETDAQAIGTALSVTEAADRIEQMLADASPATAPAGDSVSPGAEPTPGEQPAQQAQPPANADDPRSRLLAEFADVLGTEHATAPELLGRLAALAHQAPARFERLQELVEASRAAPDRSAA